MDWGQLAAQIAALTAPLLPYLLKAGEKAAEEAGKQIGGNAWDKVKTLWGKLSPKIESKPAALEAAQEVAKTPDDEDARELCEFS